jgi:hypothetical protein
MQMTAFGNYLFRCDQYFGERGGGVEGYSLDCQTKCEISRLLPSSSHVTITYYSLSFSEGRVAVNRFLMWIIKNTVPEVIIFSIWCWNIKGKKLLSSVLSRTVRCEVYICFIAETPNLLMWMKLNVLQKAIRSFFLVCFECSEDWWWQSIKN